MEKSSNTVEPHPMMTMVLARVVLRREAEARTSAIENEELQDADVSEASDRTH